MGHPASRAARRAARQRVIARRLFAARNVAAGYDPDLDAPRPDHPASLDPSAFRWPLPARLDKSYAWCTCSWCKGLREVLPRWRWDGVLLADLELPVAPRRQEGIGRRLRG